MSTSFIFTNKAKLIADLKTQLADMTKDRDTALKAVEELKDKEEQAKQAAAAFSLGASDWVKEKTTLIDAHNTVVKDLTAKMETEKATLIQTHETVVKDLTAKLEAVTTDKDNLVKAHTAEIETLQAEHKKESEITEEKINKQAAVKLNAMNFLEGELPASDENETITIEQARKTLASLTGKEKRDFFKQHKAMFEGYMKNPNNA